MFKLRSIILLAIAINLLFIFNFSLANRKDGLTEVDEELQHEQQLLLQKSIGQSPAEEERQFQVKDGNVDYFYTDPIIEGAKPKHVVVKLYDQDLTHEQYSEERVNEDLKIFEEFSKFVNDFMQDALIDGTAHKNVGSYLKTFYKFVTVSKKDYDAIVLSKKELGSPPITKRFITRTTELWKQAITKAKQSEVVSVSKEERQKFIDEKIKPFMRAMKQTIAESPTGQYLHWSTFTMDGVNIVDISAEIMTFARANGLNFAIWMTDRCISFMKQLKWA